MRFGFVFVLLLMGSVSAISICVDNVAPEAPSNLVVSGSVGSIFISWSAAVDSPSCSGVDYYNVSRDGEWIGTTGDLSFVDEENLGRGEYDYTVYAVDMVGGNAGASVKNSVVVYEVNVDGGDSGSSYTCEADWACEAWSECVGDEMKRVCEDVNECGTSFLKPEVYQECGGISIGENSMILKNVVEEAEISDVDRFLSSITGAVVGGGAGSVVSGGALLLLSILGLFAIRRKRKV